MKIFIKILEVKIPSIKVLLLSYGNVFFSPFFHIYVSYKCPWVCITEWWGEIINKMDLQIKML